VPKSYDFVHVSLRNDLARHIRFVRHAVRSRTVRTLLWLVIIRVRRLERYESARRVRFMR